MSEPVYLSIPKAARALGFSRHKLWRLVRAGVIPAKQPPKSNPLVNVEQAVAAIESYPYVTAQEGRRGVGQVVSIRRLATLAAADVAASRNSR